MSKFPKTDLTVAFTFSGRLVTATATSAANPHATGTSSNYSVAVAAGKAVQALFLTLEQQQRTSNAASAPAAKTAVPKSNKPHVKVFIVAGGTRHVGEKFYATRLVKDAKGVEYYVGTYEDGTTGRNKPAFLGEEQPF